MLVWECLFIVEQNSPNDDPIQNRKDTLHNEKANGVRSSTQTHESQSLPHFGLLVFNNYLALKKVMYGV